MECSGLKTLLTEVDRPEPRHPGQAARDRGAHPWTPCSRWIQLSMSQRNAVEGVCGTIVDDAMHQLVVIEREPAISGRSVACVAASHRTRQNIWLRSSSKHAADGHGPESEIRGNTLPTWDIGSDTDESLLEARKPRHGAPLNCFSGFRNEGRNKLGLTPHDAHLLGITLDVGTARATEQTALAQFLVRWL